MYLDTPPTGDSGRPANAASLPLAATLTALAVALADRSAAPADAAVTRHLDDVLRRLRDRIPGAAAASILGAKPVPPMRDPARLRAGEGPVTLGATSDLARSADQLQLALGAGPSLAGRERNVQAGAVELGQRWPELTGPLGQLGVAAVLALPLPGLGARAALTVYAETPFPIDALAPAEEAAAIAAVALVGLEARERAANLEVALATSRQIAAAVGIVMAQQRCSYEEAFQLIRTISQRTHRKMRELADAVVFSGALPGTGGSAAATG